MRAWGRAQDGMWLGAGLLVALSLASTTVVAEQPYVHSGSGEVLQTGGDECWGAVDGRPAWCGEPPDIDGDGVRDDRDDCPDTPAGETVDAKGCPPDGDRDEVPDHADQCPDTPYGVRVDTRGCALDLDGDGVPYYRDRCSQLLPQGAEVDADGCLLRLTLENVHFDFDQASLRPDARRILDRLVGLLADRDDVERLIISGHTDSKGSRAYNRGLSERRARTVAQYLLQRGVKQPFTATGYGEAYPVAGNIDSMGRAKNRRVEIELKAAPDRRR